MGRISINNKFSFDSIKKLIFVEYKKITIMVFVALTLIVLFLSFSSIFRNSENEAIYKYNKYQSYLLASKSNNTEILSETVILPSETAVDIDKINSDISSSETYMKAWFDWENGDEYDAARESVLNTFGAESVMSGIFVENARTSSGNSYVDNFDVNMSVNKIKTYPIYIDNTGNNKYLSMISVSTVTGASSIKYTIMMTYEYDSNNSILDARVFLNTR